MRVNFPIHDQGVREVDSVLCILCCHSKPQGTEDQATTVTLAALQVSKLEESEDFIAVMHGRGKVTSAGSVPQFLPPRRVCPRTWSTKERLKRLLMWQVSYRLHGILA